MLLQTGVTGVYRYAPVDKTPIFTVLSIPTDISRDPCDTWGYSQPQGDSQHCRTAHGNLFTCFFVRCEFKWTRPRQYTTHFEKWHSGANVDNILGMSARSRRRSRDLPPHSPPPAIEPDRRNQDEPQQRPLMPPLSAVPTVLSQKHEDGCKSTYAPDPAPAFSSTEERAQSVNDMGGQFRFAHLFW